MKSQNLHKQKNLLTQQKRSTTMNICGENLKIYSRLIIWIFDSIGLKMKFLHPDADFDEARVK